MSEQLYRATLRGPLRTKTTSDGKHWAGISALNSGSTTVTVSTTAVKSDSVFYLTFQSLTNQVSGAAASIEVRTIVDGSYFIMGYADGAARPRNANVHWMVVNTKE